MGHDIIIRDGKRGCILEKTGISYNWTDYSKYWHVDDARGKRGEEVAIQISSALDTLKNEGVDPNDEAKVDGWGNRTCDEKGHFSCNFEEYQKDRITMFAKILRTFLKLAWEYPHSYWYIDQDDISTEESDDSSEINTRSIVKEYPDHSITQDQLSSLAGLVGMKEGDRYVIYYNFPDTGNRAVKTKKDVLEIIEYAINEGDIRAVSWTRLAFMLPK